jgi:beta-glucosidase
MISLPNVYRLMLNNNNLKMKLKLICTALLIFSISYAQTIKNNNKPFSDKVIDARVNTLMKKMTNEDKLAQLIGIRPNELMVNGKFSIEKCRQKIPYGIGHVCQYPSSLNLKPEELRDLVRQIQQYLITETPSKIPAIFHEEAITGFSTLGATTFPQQIGISCAWNPEMVERNAQSTAMIMREGGATMALSPMLDVIKTAYWPRIEESFGEDAYLTGRMGVAFVNGLQRKGFETGIAAATKHFVGYGSNSTDEKELYEEYLFPHEAVIRVAGVKTVMPGYHKFHNGDFCIANETLLQDILRKYLNFDGLVVSDYRAISNIAGKTNKTPETLKAAGIKAINAGADVELEVGLAFPYLLEAIKEGKVTQQTFDTAVKRELVLKVKLGLLDKKPQFGKDGPLDFDPSANRKLAYDAACQSLVLLKNNGILPLKKEIKKIALVGPNATTYEGLIGDYTYQSLSAFWWNIPINPDFPKLVTLSNGLQNKLGTNFILQAERGCDWSAALEATVDTKTLGDDRLSKVKIMTLKDLPQPDLANALKIANESDVIIAAMGENFYLCGEGRSRQGIRLPGEQEAFVQKLLATGKPVILVVFGGRPQVITELESKCAAIVQVWFPGEEGGNAIADLLLGNFNPSGKLTVSYPKNEEKKDISYNNGYAKDNMPLYPFGFGLSYTNYVYSNLKVPSTVSIRDKWITVSFKIKNTGGMNGTEIAQLYLSPKEANGNLKPIQLKGFKRVTLRKGEEKSVRFKISPQQFAYYSNGQWEIAPGNYEIKAGASSTDIKLIAELKLTGTKISMPHRTVLFSE